MEPPNLGIASVGSGEEAALAASINSISSMLVSAGHGIFETSAAVGVFWFDSVSSTGAFLEAFFEDKSPFAVDEERNGLGDSRPSLRPPRKREAALRMDVGVRGLSDERFGEFVEEDDGLGRLVFCTAGEDVCGVFLGRGGVLVTETFPFSFVGCGGLKELMLEIELVILARDDRRGIGLIG